MKLIDQQSISIVKWCVDLKTAAQISPELQNYQDENGKIDLGDPHALAAYNVAIAKVLASLDISVPTGKLVPTMCLRHAYLMILTDSLIKPGDRIIEVGTGSTAILAQLAAKLHGLQVIATEIDPASYRSALKNITVNGLAHAITLVKSTGQILTGLIESYLPCTTLITYPPVYPESDKDQYQSGGPSRGFQGSVSEMIGGGSTGYDFIAQLLTEACQLPITHITLLLIFEDHASRAEDYLKRQGRSTRNIILLAGTRKRFLVIGSLQ